MLFLIYFLLINLIAVLVCVYDKNQSKKGAWRVKESFLFFLCIIGGSIGMYITMKKIRHKTLHKRFMFGIPIIIIIQMTAGLFLLKNYLL